MPSDRDSLHCEGSSKSSGRKRLHYGDSSSESNSSSEDRTYECQSISHKSKRRREPRDCASDTDSSSSSSSSSEHNKKNHKKKKQVHKRHKKLKHKSHKSYKHSKTDDNTPIQLSEFWNSDKHGTSGDSKSQRSAISGKKIKRKIKKSKADKQRDKTRKKMLKFLNSTM